MYIIIKMHAQDEISSPEISSSVVVGGSKYKIVTLNAGGENTEIVSAVTKDGEEVYSRKVYYGSVVKARDTERRIEEFMRKQHQLAVNVFRAESMKKRESTSFYLKEVRNLLRRKNNKKALDLLKTALESYPGDPFLLSYYGSLTAIIEENLEQGIDACQRALRTLDREIPYGRETFYPSFYLNLGRALLAAGRKAEAVDRFKEGLKSDPRNEELLKEMKVLGRRREPVVPFLSRSNPINKYIGMLLHKFK